MKVFSVAALLLVITASGVARTQETSPQAPPRPAGKAPEEQQTIRVTSTLVNTLFTVIDRNGKGKFITGLKRDNFRIFEDDKPQAITNFSSESNLPLSIALLIDTSSSTRIRLKAEQEAAIDFFYAVMQRSKDRGMVISYDSGVDVRQDFTDNPEKLADALRKVKPGGGTSLVDAVYLAITEKLAKEVEDRRRVLIIIGDGEDNSSERTMEDAVDVAQKHNVTIYTISTNSSAYFGTNAQARNDKNLKQFADDTGGFPFFPPKMEDMALNFVDIGTELRSQYTLAYRPVKPDDGTFRKIRIEVAGFKDYKVRHRTGYYAPPAPTQK